MLMGETFLMLKLQPDRYCRTRGRIETKNPHKETPISHAGKTEMTCTRKLFNSQYGMTTEGFRAVKLLELVISLRHLLREMPAILNDTRHSLNDLYTKR
ncbi:MAG: hypothetical protein D6728_09255 [Cyanobacteria bacterium J055]|nr:MAG: hypothetical protein D6728_09255 [Cyanobacteria bacterium J055]